MMSEDEGLITKTKVIGTKYLQGYLNFNILRKQIKYKYKRNEMPKELMDLLIETSSFKNISVLATPMPISLKKAYYEYRYGIFAEQGDHSNNFFKKSENYLYCYSIIGFLTNVGSSSSLALIGYTYDFTGVYEIILIIAMCFYIINLTLLAIIYLRYRKNRNKASMA